MNFSQAALATFFSLPLLSSCFLFSLNSLAQTLPATQTAAEPRSMGTVTTHLDVFQDLVPVLPLAGCNETRTMSFIEYRLVEIPDHIPRREEIRRISLEVPEIICRQISNALEGQIQQESVRGGSYFVEPRDRGSRIVGVANRQYGLLRSLVGEPVGSELARDGWGGFPTAFIGASIVRITSLHERSNLSCQVTYVDIGEEWRSFDLFNRSALSIINQVELSATACVELRNFLAPLTYLQRGSEEGATSRNLLLERFWKVWKSSDNTWIAVQPLASVVPARFSLLMPDEPRVGGEVVWLEYRNRLELLRPIR